MRNTTLQRNHSCNAHTQAHTHNGRYGSEGGAPASPLRLLWCGVPSLRALSPAHHTTSAAQVPPCAPLGNFILREVTQPLAPCVPDDRGEFAANVGHTLR